MLICVKGFALSASKYKQQLTETISDHSQISVTYFCIVVTVEGLVLFVTIFQPLSKNHTWVPGVSEIGF